MREKLQSNTSLTSTRACVGLMMCLGAGDGARIYGGELNTKSIPG